MTGIVPPAPGTGAVADFSRTYETRIPETAKDTDPLRDLNAALTVNKQRADFKPEQFDLVINQHGKRVRWRKAMLCPCLEETTGQAAVNCFDCDGSGYVYVDPLDIQLLMFSNDSKTRLYEKFALWQQGEAQVSMQANYRMGFRDSIESIDDVSNFNELLKKGNRRGRRSALPANTDSARYRIAAIAKIISKTSVKGSVLSAERGLHFELTEAGHIQWTAQGNKLIPDGVFYSIHYDFHPVYIVTSHPHVMRSDIKGTKEINEVVQPLPLNASVQLDFLSDTAGPLPVTGGCA